MSKAVNASALGSYRSTWSVIQMLSQALWWEVDRHMIGLAQRRQQGWVLVSWVRVLILASVPAQELPT